MGLGILGRGVGDAQFLASCGAYLTITDFKNKVELKESLKKLKKYKNIKYTLGGHKLEDFRNCDMILKSAGVPLDSIYIKEARKNNIPIKMSASLLAELSGAMVVGITGTRGKSTVTHLVYEILSQASKNQKVHLAGNVRGIANLPLLNKVKKNDIVVMELDSWQLQGFGEAKISPRIAVFTTFLDDHMNYYNQDRQKYFCDKANIFAYQEAHDYLVTNKKTLKIVNQRYKNIIKSKIILASDKDISKNWKINLIGKHNRQNIELAIKVAQILEINTNFTKKTIENFQSIPGRLEYLKEVNGVKIYNDNNATTPEATIAALKTLSKNKNIVLIMGGSDKGLDMSELIKEIRERCKVVILLKESGTDKIKDKIFKIKNLIVHEEENLEKCVKKAVKKASTGDIILYSPAFASFGKFFKNEFERGDQFTSIIRRIK